MGEYILNTGVYIGYTYKYRGVHEYTCTEKELLGPLITATVMFLLKGLTN